MLSWCRILERTLHAFGNLVRYFVYQEAMKMIDLRKRYFTSILKVYNQFNFRLVTALNYFQRKTSSEHVYSAYPVRRPPRKSLPDTPPGSPEPRGAEALPLPTNSHGENSEREEIFESQCSLMDSLRNSGNLQKTSAGLRESIILATRNSSNSDDGVCRSLPEDDVCQSVPEGGASLSLPNKGGDEEIDSDPEYSDAAWTKRTIDFNTAESNEGFSCARFKGSCITQDWLISISVTYPLLTLSVLVYVVL